MIAKSIRPVASAGDVSRYMEDPSHQFQLVDHNLPVALERPRQLPMQRTEPLAPQAADGIDALVAYMDNEEKTYAGKRTIGDAAVRAMEDRAAVRPDVKNGFLHMVIAYAPEDRGKLTNEQIKEDVNVFIATLVKHDNEWKHARAKQRGHAGPARDLEPGDLLYVAATHREKRHIHIHVLMCRVAEDKTLYYGAQNAVALRDFCEQQELRHGFRMTGRNLTLERKMAGPEQGRDERPGVLPEQAPLRSVVEGIADDAVDRDGLEAGLAGIGLRLEETQRGFAVVDEAGTRTPASRLGLGGHRSPIKIGMPKSPTDVAREEMWAAAASSSTWEEFEERLSKTGLTCTLDKRGKVTEIHRVDVTGERMAGRSWAPADLGFRRQPDSKHWQQPKGRPPRPERPPRSPDAPRREPVLLPQRTSEDDVFEQINQLRQDRDAIVARRAADHAEAVRIRAEAARQRAEQTKLQAAQQVKDQQRLLQEAAQRDQQQVLQRQVRDALADDRDRSDAVPDRASSPSVDAPRPEPTSTPSVDAAVPDAVPDDPPKPTFRMER